MTDSLDQPDQIRRSQRKTHYKISFPQNPHQTPLGQGFLKARTGLRVGPLGLLENRAMSPPSDRELDRGQGPSLLHQIKQISLPSSPCPPLSPWKPSLSPCGHASRSPDPSSPSSAWPAALARVATCSHEEHRPCSGSDPSPGSLVSTPGGCPDWASSSSASGCAPSQQDPK